MTETSRSRADTISRKSARQGDPEAPPAALAMIVEKDVGIQANDGLVLHANVFRPDTQEPCPVILAMGIYGKDVHFADGFTPQWDTLLKLYPGLCENGSSGRYLRWELVDPERWVPHGYVVVSVDSRGTGKSPGFLDAFSARETQDYHDAIEWCGRQPWSNGNVGLLGVSYYAIKQWQVAALRPPSLKAIVPWEGCNDLYRDWSHHGGIFSDLFPTAWWPRQVLVNQHGNADSHHRDRETGERTTGPAVSPELLKANRADHAAMLLDHPLDDAWYKERSADLERIEVPVLSAGNWGGQGLHLRGNIEGYMRAGSAQKWLFVHIGTHFESFYLPRYIELQRRFLDRFLKCIDNGWDDEPPVQLEIRRPDGATRRKEQHWPLERTQWTRLHLHADTMALAPEPAGAKVDASHKVDASYDAMGEGLSFSTPPFDADMEVTGPVMARLWISSSTTDMDIFATLRAFDPEAKEVIFTGASELTHVTAGWLRASHRKLDPERTLEYRPFHSHDEVQKLEPGQVYQVDVELWPTSMVFPAGYRLVLTVQGRDMEIEGFTRRIAHNHPLDRDPAEFGGVNTIHCGPDHPSFLLLPVIPAAVD